jgi:hypothetical protein
MPFFGLFKPNIDSLIRKGDVNGLIKLLESGNTALRKKAAETLASFLCLKEKPRTLDDVKKILGRYAKLFVLEQEGDLIFI